MAFKQKQISLTFKLANGTFEDGSSSKTFNGLRISCKVANSSGPTMGMLDLTVYGMSLSDMNKLSQIGNTFNAVSANSVSVSAGEAGGSMTLIFQGTIWTSWVDANAQPNVAFHVSAFPGGLAAIQPAQSTSIDGGADVATLMGQLAQQAGLTLESNSVSVQIASPHLKGSIREQISSLAEAAGIQFTIENNTLAIWQTGQPRLGSATIISPQTGMIGYPAFSSSAIILRAEFMPGLRMGQKITVKSQLTPACGDWYIFKLDLDLEALVPNGAWLTLLAASRIGVQTTP